MNDETMRKMGLEARRQVPACLPKIELVRNVFL